MNTNTALIKVIEKAPQVSDFEGRWAEETSGRCQITFTTRDTGSYITDVSWSSSAVEKSCWKMTANSIDASTLVYSDGHYWIETYADENVYTISDEAFEQTGNFTIKDGKLHWVNNDTGTTTVFVRA